MARALNAITAIARIQEPPVPEGPSIVILKEEAAAFAGRKVVCATGNARIELFRIRVHPLSEVGALPAYKLRALVEQVRKYAFEFYTWKKAFVLRQHWLAHTKSICPRCQIKFKRAHLGRTHRRSFYCERCQKKYVRR